MLLSVVTTTYNRSGVLELNLNEFKKQTDNNFEIVIAIDGSTDNTIEMLQNYDCNFPIKWIDTKETNKYCLGKARNMGIIRTTGEAVVFIDDDSFPCPEFVAEHKKSVMQRVLTGGKRTSHDPNDSLHPKMVKTLEMYGDCKPSPIKSLLVENNCCMLRKDWFGVGLFSERFPGYGGGGQEFIHRLAYLGYGYQYNPRAAIFHHREFEGDNGYTREDKDREASMSLEVLKKYLRY